MSVALRSMGEALQQWAIGALRDVAEIPPLLPDGINGVFGGHPVQGAQRPYGVVLAPAISAPLRPVGTHRFWTEARMLIKWLGDPTDHDTLVELANRADVRFEAAQFEQVGDDVLIVSCVRDGEFHPEPDQIAGVLTEQVGFFYNVKLRELGQT